MRRRETFMPTDAARGTTPECVHELFIQSACAGVSPDASSTVSGSAPATAAYVSPATGSPHGATSLGRAVSVSRACRGDRYGDAVIFVIGFTLRKNNENVKPIGGRHAWAVVGYNLKAF